MKKTIFLFLLILPFALITCDSPMGFGDAIDFEPPILTIDPGPNPRYINSNTVLSGSCTDNIEVTRIICKDVSGRILGTAVINGNRWSMSLNVSNEDNGKRMSLEIVAYDRAGNSGENSIQTISIIVDIHNPIFEEVTIWRSASRFARLETLDNLLMLETSDRFGERYQNVDKYQNGAFRISASLIDNETLIDHASTTLTIYDADNDREGMEVFSSKPHGGTAFTPDWVLKEGLLEKNGNSKGFNYTNILENGGRVYLRVSLSAYDLAKNREIREDFGYLCLYRNADKPKTVPSNSGSLIIPGSTISIDIFDDDTMAEAWVDLMTEDQFKAYGGVNDPNDIKLNAIVTALNSGAVVPNWKAELRQSDPLVSPDDKKFLPRISAGSSPETMTISLETGDSNSDYGNYILVAVVRDKKNPPHDDNDPDTRPASILTSRWFPITIADNNKPIIVIDTVDVNAYGYNENAHPGYDIIPAAMTGNSPEENTFPALTNNRFTINGYTLDENSKDKGEVVKFRIAWIPYGDNPGEQEEKLQAVKNALEHEGTDKESSNPYPAGVQHWTLSDAAYTTGKTSYFIKGTEQSIADTPYTKQTFKKTFNIMGDTPDDLNPAYHNFHNGCSAPHSSICVENEPKLFVLCAKDVDGHVSFKTIRLLGKKDKPIIKVYDLTTKAAANSAINDSQLSYADITALPRSDSDLMGPFTAYSLNTKLVLYATAASEKDDGIPIESFTMNETSGASPVSMGYFHPTNKDMTLVVQLGDIQQKKYEFEAVNALNINAGLNRTVAITGTALMDEIICDKPDGIYPAGTEITLRAHFTSQVEVRVSRPVLNIRYGQSNSWTYTTVPFSGNLNEAYMYLDFKWTVPVGATGKLETCDASTDDATRPTGFDRPISLNGARIVDYERNNVDAFLPGTAGGNIWTGGANSLQGTTLEPRKTIELDGIGPVIAQITAGGKTAYSDGNFYFKNGETISFTVTTTGKDILTAPISSDSNLTNPRLKFKIMMLFNDSISVYQDELFADYVRPDGSKSRVFEFLITDTSLPNNKFDNPQNRTGQIVITGFDFAQGKLTDPVGNELDPSLPASANILPKEAYVDKNPPRVPTPNINELPPPRPLARYTKNPTLTFSGRDGSPNELWPTIFQYSLNNGLEWVDFPTPRPDWTTAVPTDVNQLTINTGKWKLLARQLDRAGNEGRLTEAYDLDVKGDFPKISAIRAVNPDGIYVLGDRITLCVDFEGPVKTMLTGSTTARALIIVSDRAAKSIDIREEHTDMIYASRITDGVNGSTTLEFLWEPSNKEMANGIMITQLRISTDVFDLYGNEGIDSIVGTAEPFPGNGYGDATLYPYGQINIGNAENPVYNPHNINGAGLKVFTIPRIE